MICDAVQRSPTLTDAGNQVDITVLGSLVVYQNGPTVTD